MRQIQGTRRELSGLVWFHVSAESQNSPESQITITQTPSVSQDQSEASVILNVECRPPASGVKLLYELSISKVPEDIPGGKNTLLAIALYKVSDEEAQLRIDADDWVVSGSLESSYVNLTIPHATCSDGGIYVCDAVFKSTGYGLSIATSYSDVSLQGE